MDVCNLSCHWCDTDVTPRLSLPLEDLVAEDHHAGPYRTHLMNSYCHAWSCAPAYFLRNAKFKALMSANEL